MNRTSIAAAIAGLTLAAPLALAATPAHAATGEWSNTYNYSASRYSVKVKLCSGGTKTLTPGTGTKANVCAVWLPRERRIDAWVHETGTDLFGYADCGSGRWVRFTSKTDTSRTAWVFVSKVSCPS